MLLFNPSCPEHYYIVIFSSAAFHMCISICVCSTSIYKILTSIMLNLSVPGYGCENDLLSPLENIIDNLNKGLRMAISRK